jgi:hypothetical protein
MTDNPQFPSRDDEEHLLELNRTSGADSPITAAEQEDAQCSPDSEAPVNDAERRYGKDESPG